MAPNHSWRTVLVRIVVVACYVCLGSGIFFLLERNNSSEKTTSDINRHQNNTLMNILKRCHCTANQTELENILMEFQLAFPPQSPPIPWSFLRGLDLTIATMTTIGKIPHYRRHLHIIIYYYHQLVNSVCITAKLQEVFF